MTEQADCVVIGAGVVGLAIARALARAGREVIVVEEAGEIGTVTSSRNSEVIHAGLYYPPGSLKARLCRRGRDLLYSYLEDHGVAYLRCGKLVVATDDADEAILADVEARARANGVEDLARLTGAEAKALEPNVVCQSALLSPSTGIFDSHGYMLAVLGDAEDARVAVAFQTPVTGGAAGSDRIVLETGGAAPMRLACRTVVNAAGLGAQTVASTITGMPADRIPRLYYAKGSYFALAGKPPFSRLVYPVPDHASVGLHYTRDLGGRGRFGPDAEWVEGIDYDVDPRRAELFFASIRSYWPDLRDDSLTPDYAGVRPKIAAPGEPPRDFMIQGPAEHGVPGLINLFGIESPGLTASLAIADYVLAMTEV